MKEPLPYGHEVEYVGHPRAVAEEAAQAELEDDGGHQNFVSAKGRTREREEEV